MIALAAMATDASADLTPGAVFTSTNTAPNRVLAYNRGADGQLTPAGSFLTGGDGRPAANPPAFTSFPVLDSMGPVNLGDDGDNKSCLFVVNAGQDSNSVSSFRVKSSGLQLADQKSSGGSRPASVSSTARGPSKFVMYVLNSDNATASIRGFYVSGSCGLTHIPGSDRALPSQTSVPATVRFDEQGKFLTVSERYAPGPAPVGTGDLVSYPVNSDGTLGPAVVTPSARSTPYGLDYNHQGILSVTNEAVAPVPAPPFPLSSVSTYRQNKDGTLVELDNEPSPGAACWNLFSNNGKFLFVTNPAGDFFAPDSADVRAYTVDRNGEMTFVNQQPTPFEAIDNALSNNSRYLYVLSTPVVVPADDSSITAFEIDPKSGAITKIDEEIILGNNSTSGLAAW
jgi:6-phosphogluconolactonase (cycloisomerase 2 family)